MTDPVRNLVIFRTLGGFIVMWTHAGLGCQSSWWSDTMRVQVDRHDGLVRSVLLVDDEGTPVESACRFLRYVVDSGVARTLRSRTATTCAISSSSWPSVNLTGASSGHLWRSICSPGFASVPATNVCSS
jgi:hypothetical protein